MIAYDVLSECVLRLEGGDGNANCAIHRDGFDGFVPLTRVPRYTVTKPSKNVSG